ncbi:Thioesterase/thiol ester dehydrase-isomerase [Parathielavia hyrcaniae]|uniref:Thioesterase/thiol ester dehydrase-isomerase n=1 Tax=Parathielavia hyrcaniae TaxID=113614 RepID=A0AAN6PW74_9PEZI|nr:Thioesterase/thiol ester dehydrase-isomerase [Parathielavia hyrcaniae]
MTPVEEPAQSLHEALELVRLPSEGLVRRFMSTRAAYLPGSDLKFPAEYTPPMVHKAAFGGHVYAQAALAVVRAWREIEDEKGTKASDRLDLHTITGYFTRPGIPNRPFLYTVTPLTSSRTFATLSVTAHQPSESSTNPTHGSSDNNRFPPADAHLPLPPQPSFTALCSLKLPEPDSAGVSTQEPPPQQRFAPLLSSRPPSAWPPVPPVDVTGMVELAGADQAGRFPVAEMRKVDMRGYNEGRAVHERRELMLYRLRRPVLRLDVGGCGGRGEEKVEVKAEVGGDGGGGRGWDHDDANSHVVAHAYVADRNGLLLVGNHVGFGYSLARAASLSYTFVVHVNAEQAVMREDEGDGWWVQEMFFPRTAAGRGVVESKIWSPLGVHVATEYQDGLVQGLEVGKL